MTGLQLKETLVSVVDSAMGGYLPTMEYALEMDPTVERYIDLLNNTAYNFDPKKLYQALQTEQDDPELIAEAYKRLQTANRGAETDEELAEAEADFLVTCLSGLLMVSEGTEFEDLYED
jgi:hypothetical protein